MLVDMTPAIQPIREAGCCFNTDSILESYPSGKTSTSLNNQPVKAISNGLCAAFYKQQAAYSQRCNAKPGTLNFRYRADNEGGVTLDTMEYPMMGYPKFSVQ